MPENKDAASGKHAGKKADKKPRQKLSRIIENNLFVLKMIHKSAPGYIAMQLFGTVLGASLGFISDSYMLRYIMNGVQTGTEFKKILSFILAIFAASLIEDVYNRVFWNIIAPKMQVDINAGFGKAIYEKATEVELACFEDSAFYDKYVKATDSAGQKPYELMNTLETLVYSVLNISLNAFLIFAIEPYIAIFAAIPLIAGIAVRKRKKLVYDRNMARKPSERKMKYSRRAFYLNDYAKEMRLFDMYKVMFRQFGEAIKENVSIIKKYGFSISALNFVQDTATDVFAVLGATLFASYRMLVEHKILIGDAFVVINSLSSVTWTLSNSAQNMLEFGEHSLYIENLREYLAYEPKIKTGADEIPTGRDLCLKNVSFRYEGAKKDVLSDLDITFKRGEKIALVGANGAGKSTLVKLLLRLYDPSAGSVCLGETDIRTLKLDDYRRDFSVVFQDLHTFALTAGENILLRPLREGDDKLCRDAAEKAGVLERVNKLKNGFDTVLTKEFDEDGEVLSGGEYQKLSIARVFTENGEFVILDEPSSALDPIAEYKMYENMMEACRGRTVIFISHRLSSAVLADRVFLLDGGFLTESGTHSELMKQNGVYADMFRKQAANYV